MSAYIPRLREELVAAAARERAGRRRRSRVRPRRIAAAAAVAAAMAAVVIAVVAIDVPTDEAPVAALPGGTALAYRVTPLPGTDAGAAAAASADVLRERLEAAGIRGATVSVIGGRLAVDAGKDQVAQVAALAVPGKLWIYDWEASVLGPDGRPAPADSGVTGGPGSGIDGAVSQYEALWRGARAASSGGPPTYWLVDMAARRVLEGPAWTRAALPAGGDVLEVPGGVRIVRAEGAATGRWYALADSAALSNADLATARALRDAGSGDEIVTFDLDARGQAAFSALTREIARRGAAAAKRGEDPMRAVQHLAIVLDDELAAVPFVDFRQAPDGIHGEGGVQIQGGLTRERARQIATILDSGPMPATLVPVGQAP